jgi:hypothetical protein
MADTTSTDPFTNLYLDHAAIRRDIAVDTSELMKEGLKEAYNTRGDVKDTRFDIASRINGSQAELSRQVDAIDDTLSAQLVTISRESADNRAQILALGFQVRDGNTALAKDVELNSLKGMLDAQKNTTYLSDKISIDGEKTRALINDLQFNDLNRSLVERGAALVALESDNRHWGHRLDDVRWAGHRDIFGAQVAQLSTMMQNVNSQISETKQGMVNFGRMSDVSQGASANTVR